MLVQKNDTTGVTYCCSVSVSFESPPLQSEYRLLLCQQSLGWPGATQTGWTPASVAEASPHTGCHIVLVCAERILLDWWGTGVWSSVWPGARSLARSLLPLLGQVLHHLQLLHWLPLLVDGDQLQRSHSLSGRVDGKAARQKVTRWASEGMLQRTSANIITQMSPEPAATNLITLLPQWLSNFWLQAGTIRSLLNDNKCKPC